jgi:D-serine deaminase-like pyridoxal phosphate-dependent protein
VSAVAELETPALVVDLDRLERNLGRAAAYADEHGLGLHPHVKTHKTLEIARMQLDGGARGLTVAKPTEAQVFAAAELAPLLLHYPAAGPGKPERIAELAATVPLTVAGDSLAVAEPIAAQLRRRGVEAETLIELDVGLRRTGVTPGEAAELGRAIEGLGGGLRVAGLSCYPAHDELAEVDALLEQAQELFAAAGLRCERISGGSTATLFESHRTRMTELRPGNYALLDRSEARGAFGPDDCALRVQATVVSTSVPGRVILDAGSKTLSEAAPPAGERGFGAVVGHPEIVIEMLNEEHAIGLGGSETDLTVGDRVELIPNHVCTCVNLHDVLYAARGGEVEAEFAVAARGRVR